jgi:hypothetical protein
MTKVTDQRPDGHTGIRGTGDVRLELLGAMDGEDMRGALAFIAGFAPAAFDASLAGMLGHDDEGLDEGDDLEPYCSACGAAIGVFIGLGSAYLHFTGQGTAESPVELFDAGHEPVIAWRPVAVTGGPAVQATPEPPGFSCDCGRRLPWPARVQDETCPDCGTVWEHDGVDLGGGARIKQQPGSCRDYEPNFRIHGCELGAGHDGPHVDILGNEWDEHLPDEPWRCTANWGSGYDTQRCLIPAGHEGLHLDEHGNRWGEPERIRGAVAAAATAEEAEAALWGLNKDDLLAVAAYHDVTASRRDSKEALRASIAGQIVSAREEAAAAACHYCGRSGQPLKPCCERHPDDLVCADVESCRDFLLSELQEQNARFDAAEARFRATLPEQDGAR